MKSKQDCVFLKKSKGTRFYWWFETVLERALQLLFIQHHLIVNQFRLFSCKWNCYCQFLSGYLTSFLLGFNNKKNKRSSNHRVAFNYLLLFFLIIFFYVQKIFHNCNFLTFNATLCNKKMIKKFARVIKFRFLICLYNNIMFWHFSAYKNWIVMILFNFNFFITVQKTTDISLCFNFKNIFCLYSIFKALF